ncbi:MAG: hypothetical protein ACRDZQ_08280 [Acidimicrobiales bacterium]
MEISLTVAQHEVVLHACSACDQRWWHEEGQPTALPRVLELAASTRR